MKIEILGTGGTLCKALFSNALEALRESGKKGSVVVVKDIQKIMKYGVSAPAIVINGVVRFSGRLVSSEEIMALLQSNLTSVALREA